LGRKSKAPARKEKVLLKLNTAEWTEDKKQDRKPIRKREHEERSVSRPTMGHPLHTGGEEEREEEAQYRKQMNKPNTGAMYKRNKRKMMS
jgi:hypothetical protein